MVGGVQEIPEQRLGGNEGRGVVGRGRAYLNNDLIRLKQNMNTGRNHLDAKKPFHLR
jgi:hypothetical protein